MSPVLCPALPAERCDKLGKVDVLVCPAGITGATAATWDYPLDSWQRVIDINLNGLFYCGRANRTYRLGLDL
jgi:NAD(P)-dependent dehydrogenase (short-subunit alcohol dehydrogenase family)